VGNPFFQFIKQPKCSDTPPLCFSLPFPDGNEVSLLLGNREHQIVASVGGAAWGHSSPNEVLKASASIRDRIRSRLPATSEMAAASHLLLLLHSATTTKHLYISASASRSKVLLEKTATLHPFLYDSGIETRASRKQDPPPPQADPDRVHFKSHFLKAFQFLSCNNKNGPCCDF